MLRLAYKSIKHNPKRLILTAVAVALGVSLIAATQIFTHALSSGFSSLFSEIYESVDVVIEADPAAGTVLPADEPIFTDDIVAAVRAIDGVIAASGGLEADGMLLTSEREDPSGGQGGPPSLIFNWTGIPEIDRSSIVDGRAPQSVGEAVVDFKGAESRDYAVGDTIFIATEQGVLEYELVGTVVFGKSNSLQGATLVFLADEEVRFIAGTSYGYDIIAAVTSEGADNNAIAAQISELLPAGTRAISAEQKAAEEIAAFTEILQYVDIFTLAFAIIALFVGGYIIVNTFRTIVTQRTREFGLLRALGVSAAQIRTSVMLEGLLVGLIAATVGIIGGWLLALVVVAALEANAGDIFGAVIIPPMALIWGYGLGIAVTLISALLPAIHASRITPMEALRDAATQSKKSLTLRNIVGGAMALSGLLAITVGLFASLDGPYFYVGAGAMILILGVTLLAAQLLVPLATGLRGLLIAVFGVDGKLAANNIRREPRRSANAAAALMIGVMLLALVATFTESLKATFTEQFKGNEAELFILANATPIPQGAVDIIINTDGVASVARLTMGTVTWEGSDYTLGPIDADAADGLFVFNTDRDIRNIGDGVFIDPAIQGLGVKVGDTVTLQGDRGTLDLTVTGLYQNKGDAHFFVGWDTGAELLRETPIIQVLVDFEKSADDDATREAIEEALAEDFPLVQVSSPTDLEIFFNNIIDLFLGVISALLGSALVIAILGVANTLLLSVTERTREIGLLRAVGLRKRSVWRMITVESMVMAVFGTVLGIVLGVSLGAALVLSLEDFGISGVAIPWLWLGIYTVAAALAGVLAAVWPAWRASRLDILQAIATE